MLRQLRHKKASKRVPIIEDEQNALMRAPIPSALYSPYSRLDHYQTGNSAYRISACFNSLKAPILSSLQALLALQKLPSTFVPIPPD
jgi:hypothetical protein